MGVNFKKRPEEGSMKNIAFILDPDGINPFPRRQLLPELCFPFLGGFSSVFLLLVSGLFGLRMMGWANGRLLD